MICEESVRVGRELPHSDAMGLRGFGRSDKMNDQRNYREQKQQVNQSAGDVEH